MQKDIIFNYLKKKLETEILELESFKKLLEMQFLKEAKLNEVGQSLAIRADSAIVSLTKALEDLYLAWGQVVEINKDINLLK